jgi:hypothetical protein
MMDIQLYRKYLNQFVRQSILRSDGTVRSIREELDSIQVGGFLVRNKTEKRRALNDAKRAFEEHRHWPLEIILSHLGVEAPE